MEGFKNDAQTKSKDENKVIAFPQIPLKLIKDNV